jgi:GTA TIM-barrel-like domain/Putative phage tail protein
MATVVLQYAGAAVGTVLGGPIGGAIGGALGGIAGNAIDQRIFGDHRKRRIEGPRLNDLRVMTSEEGAAIPILWGRMRVAGQVIWATNLEEVASTETQKASSKGGSGASSSTTTYSYFGNFAVGLCEGEIDGIGRVWADGKIIDIDAFSTRLYTGNETQSADSLITAIEGTAPAYRGLAYIVFERLPLLRFGNRLPQLAFEIFRRGSSSGEKIKSINIIPGATEFGYDTKIVTRNDARGLTVSENAHASADRSDWSISMEQLQGACPNLQNAQLVVAWFGNDLRCGSCTVRPRVDNPSKVTQGAAWLVSNETRATAQVVSSYAGEPAFAGTPSDESVVRAIQDLHTRGLAVTFYPFVMMDIPAANTLPDPYGGVTQQAYPWRGRMTANIAPGLAGTPDKTAAVTTQLNAFNGTCIAAQFSASGAIVSYTGPAQWSYRRMVLHYAKLCAAAGGVESFLLGSELRGLTTLRSAASTYDFVTMLRTLAADVKAILPGAKISYAADWSEYFGHRPVDASGDVYFHLDPLWADAAIDFIGIDNYMPLSDWRDGRNHLDALAGFKSAQDKAYLTTRIAGGEGYDWYYATAAARDTQTRTTITDGAYGKPWMFRYKDLVGWWSNTHFNRPAGVQSGVATAWAPQSKPIWFTEAGCPAVDKGPNQPNVFYDVKSSESALPYYSGGQRDDVVQNCYIAAVEKYWSTAGAHNPISSVYGGNMVRADRTAWWAWDARPFPAFPARTDVWSDGLNYPRGHWLNGRLGAVDLGELIADIAARFALTEVDVTAVSGLVDGFVQDRPLSGREALEGLLRVFAIDVVETAGKLVFKPRATSAEIVLSKGQLAEGQRNAPILVETRLQELDLPRVVRLGYIESALDYRAAAVQQTQASTFGNREVALQLPAAVSQSLAQTRVDVALAEAWAERSTAQFSLPPSLLALEPGDVVRLDGKPYRLTTITDQTVRSVEAVLHDASVYDVPALVERLALPKLADVFGKADVLFMDLALANTEQPAAPWMAAQAKPWPGSLSVFRQTGSSSFAVNSVIGAQATMGETITALPQGVIGRVDYSVSITVQLDFGALASVSRNELLAGANAVAIGTVATGYEILQFQTATLIAANVYRVSGLLRAQAGSRVEMVATRAAGQRFIVLNSAVAKASVSLAEAALPSQWRVGPPSLDHGHPAYVALDVPATLKALRPLAPTQLKARRTVGGVTLNWIRQTRSGGDAWDLLDVPLAEANELYTLKLVNGATVLRQWSPIQQQQFYSDAEMLADFGSAPNTLTFRVAQVSAAVGNGPFLERTLNV